MARKFLGLTGLVLAVAATIGLATDHGRASAHLPASAFTVTGSANSSASFTEQVNTSFGTTIKASVSPNFANNLSYTSGTGSGQVDVKYCVQDTTAASGADTVDLAGTLLNEFAVTTTFAKIKVLAVKAAATNSNDVWVGGAATNRWTAFLKDSSVVVIRPGYMINLNGPGTGYTVTATTNEKLLVKNSGAGTPVVWQLCLAGTSS